VKKTRILVVDDEVSITKFVRAALIARGYEVVIAMNGSIALQTFERELPDLILLDINMPLLNGFEVCRRLREWTQVPIIMLSAIGYEADKVKCLNLGADDYITKPFGEEELLARIKAVLRRTEASAAAPVLPTFSNGDLMIIFAERRVTVAGSEVKLTPTEYNLLQELVINAGKVLTHIHLLNKVWGPEYREENEYLHVYIGRLRNKLESKSAESKHIIAVPGVGYRFQRICTNSD
jgi:two-component system, OmpR family, KDP operon response regulator KdpE